MHDAWVRFDNVDIHSSVLSQITSVSHYLLRRMDVMWYEVVDGMGLAFAKLSSLEPNRNAEIKMT